MSSVLVFVRGIRYYLALVIALAMILPAQLATATASPLKLEPEPNSYWQQSSDLLISAYQRDETGMDIQILEVYNDGKVPINVNDWTIEGVFKSGNVVNVIAMQLETSLTGGLLEPGRHVVIDAGGMVQGTSYAMERWSATKPNSILTTLITKKADMATHEYVLKETSTKIDGETVTIYDDLWRRSPITTGYSSSTSSFTVGSDTIYDDGLYNVPSTPRVEIVEIYPYASSCDPFDQDILCRDYVKLHNSMAHSVELDDYVLRSDSSSASRTTANTISLDGVVIPGGGYYTISYTDASAALSLTNSGGYVWIEDVWGMAKYPETLASYESAGVSEQGYSWALDGDGSWRWSLTPQPSGGNVVTSEPTSESELSSCPPGKYRNPETNRCRTIEEAVNALAACPEGQSRNTATNRCRSDATQQASGLTPCKEGQERNPASNRCRSIASAVAELIPCDEDQERNPATNRCRKTQTVDMPLAGFPIEPVKPSSQSSAMWWVLAGVAALLAGYAAWEWRSELGLAARKVAVVTRLKK